MPTGTGHSGKAESAARTGSSEERTGGSGEKIDAFFLVQCPNDDLELRVGADAAHSEDARRTRDGPRNAEEERVQRIGG